MNRYRFSVVMGALTALLVLSCTKETLFEERSFGSDALCFRVSTDSWGDTLSFSAGTVQSSVQDSLPVAVLRGASLPPLRSLATEGDGPETRGAAKIFLVPGVDTFRVACYVNNVMESGATFDPDNCSLYFDREVSNSNGEWRAVGGWNNSWMPVNNMRFCAWWPMGSTTGSAPQGNYAFHANTKKLSFQLDKPYAGEKELNPAGGHYAAEDQQDLLISVMDYGNSMSRPMSLMFNHALTAVQFSISNNMLNLQGATVRRITIKNVAYKGELDLMRAASGLSGAWTVAENSAADLADFTVRPSSSDPVAGTFLLNGDGKTFFMLPQSLENVVDGHPKEVEIECEKGGETLIFSAGLYLEDNEGNPISWIPGQTVQYLLAQKSPEAYVIYASCQSAGAIATSTNISVSSYNLSVNQGVVTKTQVPFRVTGVSIDEGRHWNNVGASVWTDAAGQVSITPWITNLATIDPTHTSLRFGGNTPNSTTSRMVEIDSLMQAEPWVDDRDLSYYDAHGAPIGSRYTANCYVVSGAGSYKFPAVYGNAIQNGADSLSICSNENFRNFNTSQGDNPRSPWIKEDFYWLGNQQYTIAPSRAVVLWQQSAYYTYPANTPESLTWHTDTQLIDTASVSYSVETGMISFTTNTAQNMHQGNAVIALLDEQNRVLWSWHIWFTSVMKYLEGSTPAERIQYTDAGAYAGDVYIGEEIDNGDTQLWARENLGAVYWGYVHHYPSRSVLLRLQQTDSGGNLIQGGSTAKVRVVQNAGEGNDYRLVLNTYYQGGNKNPVPMYTPEKTTKYWTKESFSLDQSNSLRDYSSFCNIQLDGMTAPMSDVSVSTETKLVQEAVVRQPWMMYSGYGRFKGMWLYNNHKTIYDPCPYPYSVGDRLKATGLSLQLWQSEKYRVINPNTGAILDFPFSGLYSYYSSMTNRISNIRRYSYYFARNISESGTIDYYYFDGGGANPGFTRAANNVPSCESIRPTRPLGD